MEPLIIILIAIIWILYGIHAANQDKTIKDGDTDATITKYVVMILFSPIVFVCKALYGAFKEYN